MRRALLLLLLVPALAAAGCGGSPNPGTSKQRAFIEKYGQLEDAKLAKLCPSLYPTDYLRRPKHYRYSEKDRRFRPTPAQLADAKAAGCTNRGTKPKD